MCVISHAVLLRLILSHSLRKCLFHCEGIGTTFCECDVAEVEALSCSVCQVCDRSAVAVFRNDNFLVCNSLDRISGWCQSKFIRFALC